MEMSLFHSEFCLSPLLSTNTYTFLIPNEQFLWLKIQGIFRKMEISSAPG